MFDDATHSYRSDVQRKTDELQEIVKNIEQIDKYRKLQDKRTQGLLHSLQTKIFELERRPYVHK